MYTRSRDQERAYKRHKKDVIASITRIKMIVLMYLYRAMMIGKLKPVNMTNDDDDEIDFYDCRSRIIKKMSLNSTARQRRGTFFFRYFF